MIPCAHHPDIEAARQCERCALWFCDLCLPDRDGHWICNACAQAAAPAPGPEASAFQPPLALLSLLAPAAGYLFCALLLTPFTSCAGLALGMKSLREAAPRHPPDRPLAVAGIVVSVLTLAVWLMMLAALFLDRRLPRPVP